MSEIVLALILIAAVFTAGLVWAGIIPMQTILNILENIAVWIVIICLMAVLIDIVIKVWGFANGGREE